MIHDQQDLPAGRAELYDHCVRVLLEYWRRELYRAELRSPRKPYDAKAAQSVLARLAWWMHQQQDRTAAALDQLVAEAEKGLADLQPSSGLGRDGEAFLQRMREEAGILAMEPSEFEKRPRIKPGNLGRIGRSGGFSFFRISEWQHHASPAGRLGAGRRCQNRSRCWSPARRPAFRILIRYRKRRS